MKDNETFQAGFKDVDASGYGSGDQNSKGGPQRKAGVLQIRRSDQATLNAHVEDLASGKAVVVDG